MHPFPVAGCMYSSVVSTKQAKAPLENRLCKYGVRVMHGTLRNAPREVSTAAESMNRLSPDVPRSFPLAISAYLWLLGLIVQT